MTKVASILFILLPAWLSASGSGEYLVCDEDEPTQILDDFSSLSNIPPPAVVCLFYDVPAAGTTPSRGARVAVEIILAETRDVEAYLFVQARSILGAWKPIDDSFVGELPLPYSIVKSGNPGEVAEYIIDAALRGKRRELRYRTIY